MAHAEQPLTSEALASYLRTHAVVVRRTLAGLRELGYVCAAKGHGGGWTLCGQWRSITLRDIYDAVGSPAVFAMSNRLEAPQCLVEQAVNDALDDAFHDAEALLIGRLSQVTLGDLATDFSRRQRNRSNRSRIHEH